jgi:hypothetical protein
MLNNWTRDDSRALPTLEQMHLLQPLCTACVFCLVLMGCGMCSDTVKTVEKSPDGKLTATLFVRDCGATTDFSTIVSVHRPDSTFKDDSGMVFVVKGESAVKSYWDGSRSLRIECQDCKRKDVFSQLTVLGDVDISYK